MEAGSQIHESNSGLSVRQFQRVIMGVDPGTNVMGYGILGLSLIQISEPKRRTPRSDAVFCLKKKNQQ